MSGIPLQAAQAADRADRITLSNGISLGSSFAGSKRDAIMPPESSLTTEFGAKGVQSEASNEQGSELKAIPASRSRQ